MIVDDVTRVLPELRAEAEALMVDTCTITAPGAPSWNDTTGTYTPGSPVTAYSGKCRVQVPVSVPGSQIAGEAEWVTAATVVSVPITGSTTVDVGNLVTITACVNDPALVNKTFAVVGVPLRKTFATARRLHCQAVER